MQLSAPTLPIDPTAARSADAGFPAVGGKGDANSSSASDFGAMLSAESRGNNRSSSTARSHPRAATKESNRSIEDNRGTREFSRGGRSTSSSRPSHTEANSTTAPETNAVEAGLIVPTPAAETEQEPPISGVDLTLNLESSAVSGEEANTPSGVIGFDEGSAAFGQSVPGTTISEEMAAGTSRVGIHPNGVGGETIAASPGNSVLAQSAPAAVSTAATSSEINSTRSSAASTANANSSVSEAVGLGAQSAIAQGNNAAVAVATDAVPVEQSAGDGGEAPESAEPEILQPLAAKVPDDGSVDGAEINARGATAAVEEKIAAQLSRSADRVGNTSKSAQRVALDAAYKEVAASYGGIGINVAKPEAPMASHASTSTPAPVAIEHASFAAMPLSFDNLFKEGGDGAAGQMAQVARRAVESALAVADQYVTGDQRSVKLQFTVGGEQLAVRVELKGNQVHTTFRTDSPELRNALAQEWQTVTAAQTGMRTQRLADPVFASNSSTGQGMSSDSGAAHQRDSGPRHPQTAPDEIFSLRNAFPTTSAAPVLAMAAPVTAAREPNSIRLHTFA